MSAARGARLLADVGGTHARFAWQAAPGARMGPAVVLHCAGHGGLEDAIGEALRRLGRPEVQDCAIAIATPVLGDEVRMTNCSWAFSARALRSRFGFRRLEVLNDFTALALSLPHLPAGQLRQVGGQAAQAGAPLAVVGPGTGLGVSGLLPDGGGGWCALAGEGGHVTLAATTPGERQVIKHLAVRYGHVSAERVLSGEGLQNLYAVLADAEREPVGGAAPGAAEIAAAALAGTDRRCGEALRLFCSFLGIVAGNLALQLGARGGVYLGGGIVPRLGTWLDASPFRARFEGKGRFRSYLAQIPVHVVAPDPPPALIGAALALDRY